MISPFAIKMTTKTAKILMITNRGSMSDLLDRGYKYSYTFNSLTFHAGSLSDGLSVCRTSFPQFAADFHPALVGGIVNRLGYRCTFPDQCLDSGFCRVIISRQCLVEKRT